MIDWFMAGGVDKYLIGLGVLFVIALILEGRQKSNRNRR